jgi:hypothetical protein
MEFGIALSSSYEYTSVPHPGKISTVTISRKLLFGFNFRVRINEELLEKKVAAPV